MTQQQQIKRLENEIKKLQNLYNRTGTGYKFLSNAKAELEALIGNQKATLL